MAPHVTIVIPNWNGEEHFAECLATLSEQTYTDFDIVVVDNDSSDGSVAWLKEHAPDIQLIERAGNDGFAAAVNDGIRVATGEYIVLLNNDTAAEPAWLETLVDALEASAYDFAASLMLFYDAPELVNTAGDVFSLWHLEGRQRGARKNRSGYTQRQRVLGASGGAVMYRRSFFDAVGLYDEDFFVLHEDTDINLRALIAGMRCVYVPESVVRHKVGSAIKKHPNPRMRRISMRNQFIVLGKNLPAVLAPWAFVSWLWLSFRNTIPLRPAMWRLIPQRVREYQDLLDAQREGLNLGLSKRAEVWSRRRVGRMAVLRWLLSGVGRA
ncbi:MAG: glycosyltransferase family 2 protein [Coriobacteriia bacterium]|nr:glycosyltransferase family 2 protein [Coriobacteriia bacterium]